LSATTETIAATKPPHRSRVTNGSALFADVDGRTAAARRNRDVLDDILTQVGDATASQLILTRRAAALSVGAEGQEAAIARGEPVNVGELTTAANTTRRLLSDLGITSRRQRRS
jgi:hypothetical protein